MVNSSTRDASTAGDGDVREVAPPIAGRERELAELNAIIDSAGSGHRRVVLLSGEPGIGKSRLLLHAAEVAGQQGWLVLRGSCYEDAQMSPYAPFIEVLRDLLRPFPEANETIDRIAARPELASLAPELANGGEAARLESFSEQEQRQRLFDAYGRLLVAAGSQRPIVLIVDDLHWADGPSAQLLRHLIRMLRHSATAILCAYRDSDLERGGPFETVLLDLNREQPVRRLTLRRLDAGATAEIVARVANTRADQIATQALEVIQRESEGVPFFVEELTLHLSEEGLLAKQPSGRWELVGDCDFLVPQSVRGVIGRRLARLDPTARDVLALASVSGREFGQDVLLEVAAKRGLGDSLVLGALDEAASRRLLLRQAGGYVFVHEQIREVLYQTLSAIRRRQLHQLTAEAIERLAGRDPSAASRLAYHFSRGDDLDRALHFSVAAARESTRVHALVEAIRLYNNALDILEGFDRPDTDRQVFDILLELDTVLASAGEQPARTRGIERLLLLSEHLGLHERAAALERASADAREAGRHVDAVAFAGRAVASAEHLPPAAQIDAYLALGQALTGRPIGEPSPLFRDRDRLTEALQVFKRAWTSAADDGETQRQAAIAQEIGVLEWALVGNDEDEANHARSWLLRALDGFRAVGDRKGEVTALIALAYRRTIAPSATTDLRESYVSFLEEIRRLRATEHRLSRVSERPRTEALALLSIDLYSRTNGWYEVALRRATQALALADEARDVRLAVMARIGLSETERMLGRYPQAIEHAERALAAIDGSSSNHVSVVYQRDAAVQALAAAYALAGDSDRALVEARQRVERAADGPAAGLAEALSCLAEIAVLAGDAQLAADIARRAIQATAALTGGITWDVRAELVLARVALVVDDAHLALGHAMAASGKLSERELPHIQLQIASDLVRGQALLATGFVDDAREALAAARTGVLRIAERMSDQSLRSTYLTRSSVAIEVLAAASGAGLGEPSVGGAETTEAAPDLLTRREVEVLQHVASGLPNREIAERLYISEKTVARHLTNIFTKLDVESRTQAAAWAFRQGIA